MPDADDDTRGAPRKVLFVCSRNRIRSLTAEQIFAREPGLQVRSAGTERSARVRVTAGHLGWADLVVVMEKRHRERLVQKFPEQMRDVAVACLFIPDDFAFMDEALIDLLRVRMAAVLAPDGDDG
jgi:predicted protein tyrosine phosphatase